MDWVTPDFKDEYMMSKRSNMVPKSIKSQSLFNVVVKGTLGEEFTEFE